MGEQVGKSHLPTSPCRHRAAFTGADLHVGRHVSQPHEFQLSSREEEHVFGLELPDEGFLHMAEHRSPHETHRDRRGGGDRADVQPMQAGDGFFAHPEAFGLRIPFEFSVTGIRAKAVSALFQELQAPVPIITAEVCIGSTASHGVVAGFGFQARAAGQAGEVLQQHIEGRHRRLALLHQSFAKAPANGAQFQQLQCIGWHEQHLGRAPR